MDALSILKPIRNTNNRQFWNLNLLKIIIFIQINLIKQTLTQMNPLFQSTIAINLVFLIIVKAKQTYRCLTMRLSFCIPKSVLNNEQLKKHQLINRSNHQVKKKYLTKKQSKIIKIMHNYFNKIKDSKDLWRNLILLFRLLDHITTLVKYKSNNMITKKITYILLQSIT